MIEDYPRILLSKNGIFSSENFGPYPYQKPVEMVIEHLVSVYPIANCPYEVGSKQLDQWKQNCPRRENGKCSAPCDWQVPPEEYRSYFEKIEKILTKDNTEIIQKLRGDMQSYSDDYDFENARRMKELIVYYHSLMQKFDLPVLL
jgi:excinuclease ABC subunit C